jgi:hypothetical protein
MLAKLPERVKINPMTLVCPRCHAISRQACNVLAGELDLVHVERIAAAAAKTVEARHRAGR